jgi:hypothetical protein
MDSYRASSAEKSASFWNTGLEGRRRSALLKSPVCKRRAFWNACLGCGKHCLVKCEAKSAALTETRQKGNLNEPLRPDYFA